MAIGSDGKGRGILASTLGFTLVEVIVSIVMAGALGAVLATTLGKGLSRSAQPITWTRDHFQTMQLIERVTAAYRKQMEVNTDNALPNLKTLIEDGTLVDLAVFGVQTKYIGFDTGHTEKSVPEGNTILKVTISRKSDGQKAVVIYTN